MPFFFEDVTHFLNMLKTFGFLSAGIEFLSETFTTGDFPNKVRLFSKFIKQTLKNKNVGCR